MRIAVAYAAPGAATLVTVDLPAGATAAEAVERSGLVGRLGLDTKTLRYAIFGQAVRADTPLADGDRVELTRPLLADPKAARLQRAAAASLAKAAPVSKRRARNRSP